jgi:hypothetical protein
MAMAEAADDDGDSVSCCTAAANECGEVTIWQKCLLPVEANDDGDGTPHVFLDTLTSSCMIGPAALLLPMNADLLTQQRLQRQRCGTTTAANNYG